MAATADVTEQEAEAAGQIARQVKPLDSQRRQFVTDGEETRGSTLAGSLAGVGHHIYYLVRDGGDVSEWAFYKTVRGLPSDEDIDEAEQLSRGAE